MQINKLYYSELENRFDPRYHNTTALKLLRKIKQCDGVDGFKSINLKEFGSLKKGIFSIPASEYKPNGIPFIRVSCIKYLTIDVNDLTYLSEEWHKKEFKTKLMPGDIVISKGGTIGNIALIPGWLGECNVSQDVVAFRVNDKRYSGFLAAYLNSSIGKIQMEKVKTLQTHAHLTLTPLKTLKVLLNENIVEITSKLMRNATDFEGEFFKNLELAKNCLEKHIPIEVDDKHCRTYRLDSRKLDSKFLPRFYYPPYLKSNEILKSHYKTAKLGKIAKIIQGVEVGSKNYRNDGTPFIRTSDLVNYGIDRQSYHRISDEIYNKFERDLAPGDILFTNDGKIGLSALFAEGDNCVIQSHIKRIRIFDKSFSPEYIFTFLNTDFGQYQIKRRIFIQSTISTIENGLEDIDIPYIDNGIMDDISHYCKKAISAKFCRNNLVDKSVMTVESMLN